MTLKEYYNFAKLELAKYYEDREADALCRRLLEDKYNISKEDLVINPNKKYRLGGGFYSALRKLCYYNPIQHITGFQEFMGYKFHVTKNTLIPRGETEELVSLILEDYKDYKEPLSILDIGTGSGAIAISLSLLLQPNKPASSEAIDKETIKDTENVIECAKNGENKNHIKGVDVSKLAVRVAKKNAQLLQSDAKFSICNFLSADKPKGKWSIIVSNPPYITRSEESSLPKNVIGHDPDKALFVEDENPLVFYSEISQYAYTHLKEGGRLYFEINERFGKETVDEVKKAGFKDVYLLKDMCGKDRFVWTQK